MRLTKPQQSIYDLERFAGGSSAVICGVVMTKGYRDIPSLQHAVNELYRINDGLRIRIKEDGTGVRQEIAPYEKHEVKVLRFDNREDFDRYADGCAKTPFDLHGDLCELTVVLLPDHFGVLAKLHHIIGDAWTLSLIATQYHAILGGEIPDAYSYADYLESEEKYLSGKRYQKDREFFSQQFKKCDEALYLCDKRGTSFTAARKTFVIEKDQAKIIREYADRSKTSPYMLFATALAAYISRVRMNAEGFYLGTPVLNRSGHKEKNTAGVFINTVPMLIELDNSGSFADNLRNIEEAAYALFRHQKFNYGDVLADIRKTYGFGEKLYDVVISYQNASISVNDTQTTWYHCGMQTESLQIHIDDRDNEGIFRIHYDHLVDCFTDAQIETLHRHLLNLLFSGMEDDSKKLYELDLLTEDEKQRILFSYNDTAADYPREKCVHRLFEEQVGRTPDKKAVIACDKTLSYIQLNEQANRIAHSLIQRGVKSGDIVAFILPRTSVLTAAILSILKAGAAYLPIDPDYPRERVDYMLSDSGARLCITSELLDELLDNDNTDDPGVDVSPESPCYCIYTSGSTGKPKGTLISHRNAVNYVTDNERNVYSGIIKKDYHTIVSVTTVGFDIFVTECLLPLVNSLEMLLADEKQAKFQSELNRLLSQHPADVIQTTPTRMKSLIADKNQAAYLKRLKAIILGGEALDSALVRRLQKLTDAAIYNIYGPTEATVWVTYTQITDAEDITIGKPSVNTQIYIADHYMQPVPEGVSGELCIAGDCVCKGYLNRSELTAEKFIDNPFGRGKLYRTGDLAYWREDGNIVYIGRNDFQVKIRGQRIELGEIESALASVEGISQAVAVVRTNGDGRQLICAFYTGENLSAKDIRKNLGEHLPKYMLPHSITHIEEMPLTSSGKIDRKALPEVDLSDLFTESEHIAPQTELQKALCRLIGEVLNLSDVGITDDFFDIGGDSLKAIELVSKAHEDGIFFQLQDVFDCPTVNLLSERIIETDRQHISYKDYDFSRINAVISKNTIGDLSAPEPEKVGNLLLTGATGYLGIHILAEYLDTCSSTAYCLVRGNTQQESDTRLRELLRYYFGDKYAHCSRIEVLCSDVSKERFDLSEEDYDALLSSIDTVVNCAASVKHFGSYQYFYEANVVVTQRLIEFCQTADAKLIHTSTLSVSGNSFVDEFSGSVSDEPITFTESDLYIGQPLENVYARSKFEAEKLVLDAMADGLQANIMRMGNLTNRTDGVFQKNYLSNAFVKRIKAVLEMGVVPEYLSDIYLEFTPIDEAAKAVMTLISHFREDRNIFHINSTKVVYMERFIDIMAKLGKDIRLVSEEEFLRLFHRSAKSDSTKYLYETFINDMDKDEKLVYDSNIRIDNRFTEHYLNRLGFDWGEIGIDYLQRYIEWFIRIDYFE